MIESSEKSNRDFSPSASSPSPPTPTIEQLVRRPVGAATDEIGTKQVAGYFAGDDGYLEAVRGHRAPRRQGTIDARRRRDRLRWPAMIICIAIKHQCAAGLDRDTGKSGCLRALDRRRADRRQIGAHILLRLAELDENATTAAGDASIGSQPRHTIKHRVRALWPFKRDDTSADGDGALPDIEMAKRDGSGIGCGFDIRRSSSPGAAAPSGADRRPEGPGRSPAAPIDPAPLASMSSIAIFSTASSPPDSSVRRTLGIFTSVFSVGWMSRHSGRRRTPPDMTTRPMPASRKTPLIAVKLPIAECV